MGKPSRKNSIMSVNDHLSEENAMSVGEIVAANAKYLFTERVKTDSELLDRLSELFTECTYNNDVPTMEKVALCLGVTLRTVDDWSYSPRWAGTARSLALRKARQISHAIESDLALRGYIPPIVYIFRGKNFYSMVDTPVQYDALEESTENVDITTVIEKYAAGMPTLEAVQKEATVMDVDYSDIEE